MPQLGIYHDDAVYVVTAKSLASGNGYRIESMPEQPYQTKFPPVFPALLAMAWRLGSTLESTIGWASLLEWLMLPLLLAACWRLYRDQRFHPAESAVLCAFLALSPVVVMFSVLLMAELTFCVLVVTALLLAERGKAAAAGVVAGLAFLTRCSGVPLLLSVPLVFALRRQWSRAFAFGGAMLPFVAGWQVWTATHRAPGDDLTMYYVNYLGFWRLDVTWSELPDMVWANVSSVIKAIGELLVFDEEMTFGTLTLARMLSVGVVIGSWRLAKEGRLRHYAAFAVAYAVQFLVWNYPPNSRFLLPVLPLLAAAILREGEHIAGILRASFAKPKLADRLAAGLVSVLLLGLVAWTARQSHFGIFRFLPEVFAQHRANLEQVRPAYQWLVRNTELHDRVFSYNDPVVYLYTGRRGYGLRVPPGLLKRCDVTELGRFFGRLPDLAARHGVKWVLLAPSDYHMDVQAATLPVYRQTIQSAYAKVHGSAGVAVFRDRSK